MIKAARIFSGVLNLIAAIILIPFLALQRGWLKVSRKVLKPYFGIETRAYLRWHDRHAKRIQRALDKERMNRSSLNIISL